VGLMRHGGFKNYRNAHKGNTVYVIGSGATLGHVDPNFFSDKICVCVNFAGVTLNLREFYSVTHHHDDAQNVALQRADLPVITTEVEQVPATDTTLVPATAFNIIKVPSIDQQYGAFNAATHWPTEPDVFVVGPSSVTLALHWAYYVGASSIVLAGVDCGQLDGQGRVANYPDGHLHYRLWQEALDGTANYLRKAGVNVYSLNPFTTLALEGHFFSQS